MYEFDFINRDTGFIVGDVSGTRAFYTYDKGETWNTIGPYSFSSEIAIINSNEFMWSNREKTFYVYKKIVKIE